MLLQWAFLLKQWAQLAALHYCVVVQLRPDGKDNKRNAKPILPAWRHLSRILAHCPFLAISTDKVMWQHIPDFHCHFNEHKHSPLSKNSGRQSQYAAAQHSRLQLQQICAALGLEWPKGLAEILELRQCFQDSPKWNQHTNTLLAVPNSICILWQLCPVWQVTCLSVPLTRQNKCQL